jgi:hypothetical protein
MHDRARKPSGAHTHSEMGDGNGWLVILAIFLLAASAGPVAHAVSDLIEVLAIIMAVVLVVLGLAAVLTYRVRHRDTRMLTQRSMRVLPAPEPRAMGRTQELHLHFRGVTAEGAAAIIDQQNKVCDQEIRSGHFDDGETKPWP